MKKKISIVTPTFNEDQNIEKLIFEIKKIMNSLGSKYDYEHIVIDNKSTDNTIDILKRIAKNKKNLRVIINSRNFGHIRSPFYGLLQTKGDASILSSLEFTVGDIWMLGAAISWALYSIYRGDHAPLRGRTFGPLERF